MNNYLTNIYNLSVLQEIVDHQNQDIQELERDHH